MSTAIHWSKVPAFLTLFGALTGCGQPNDYSQRLEPAPEDTQTDSVVPSGDASNAEATAKKPASGKTGFNPKPLPPVEDPTAERRMPKGYKEYTLRAPISALKLQNQAFLLPISEKDFPLITLGQAQVDANTDAPYNKAAQVLFQASLKALAPYFPLQILDAKLELDQITHYDKKDNEILCILGSVHAVRVCAGARAKNMYGNWTGYYAILDRYSDDVHPVAAQFNISDDPEWTKSWWLSSLARRSKITLEISKFFSKHAIGEEFQDVVLNAYKSDQALMFGWIGATYFKSGSLTIRFWAKPPTH